MQIMATRSHLPGESYVDYIFISALSRAAVRSCLRAGGRVPGLRATILGAQRLLVGQRPGAGVGESRRESGAESRPRRAAEKARDNGNPHAPARRAGTGRQER